MTIRLEPREIRIVNFDSKPRDWSAIKQLQTRTEADFIPPPPKPQPKPIPVDNHPLLGIWEYKGNGALHTREFTKDGLCILKQGDHVIWSKTFTATDKKSLLVEGHYTHQLQPDGILLIENNYKAQRKK